MASNQTTQLHQELTTAYFEHAKILKSYAYKKIDDRILSEDLVQDTFMKTWTYLLKGGKIHLMKAFLYHILNNLIVDEFRRPKKVSLDMLIEKGLEPVSDNSQRLNNFVDGNAAILLIKRLPEKYQKILYMRYVEDMSLKAISLVTGQSRNATTVQVHRGLQKLRKLYDTA